MGLSKRVRFEVFKRDKFTCAYCGRRPPEVILECDHIVPRCEGGPDNIENLVTSCDACNRGKSGKGLGDVAPAVDEMQRLEAMQEMAERGRLIRAQIFAAEDTRNAEEEMARLVIGWWEEMTGWYVTPYHMSRRTATILRFVSEIGPDEVRDAVRVVAGKKHAGAFDDHVQGWRYFCGVCKRKAIDMGVRR